MMNQDKTVRSQVESIWPEGIRCVTLLTFDVDGVASWLRLNPDFRKFPSLMSMAEYGPSVAMHYIFKLLDKYSIKATFFIPGYVAETHEALVEEVVSSGHDLGHHGYMHEPPATMNVKEEGEVLDRGIEILKRITGHVPIGYRSPSWELSEHSLSLLASRGFIYDASMMGDDKPYFVDAGDTQIVEIPSDWSLTEPYWSYVPAAGRRFPPVSPEQVYKIWSEAFIELYDRGGGFCLALHPQRIGRPGRLRMLEQLIRLIRSYPDVAFMRCVDVAKLLLDRRKCLEKVGSL